MKTVIIDRDDTAKLDHILRRYTQYYVSDDIKTVVLVAEGFGAETMTIRGYLGRVQYGLRRIIWC